MQAPFYTVLSHSERRTIITYHTPDSEDAENFLSILWDGPDLRVLWVIESLLRNDFMHKVVTACTHEGTLVLHVVEALTNEEIKSIEACP